MACACEGSYVCVLLACCCCLARLSPPSQKRSTPASTTEAPKGRKQQAGRGCIDQLPACSLQRQPKRGAVRHAPPPWQPASCPPTDQHVFVPGQVATAAKEEERGVQHTPRRDRSKTIPAAPRNRKTNLCVLGCEVEHGGWCQRARSTPSVARGALKYWEGLGIIDRSLAARRLSSSFFVRVASLCRWLAVQSPRWFGAFRYALTASTCIHGPTGSLSRRAAAPDRLAGVRASKGGGESGLTGAHIHTASRGAEA